MRIKKDLDAELLESLEKMWVVESKAVSRSPSYRARPSIAIPDAAQRNKATFTAPGWYPGQLPKKEPSLPVRAPVPFADKEMIRREERQAAKACYALGRALFALGEYARRQAEQPQRFALLELD